MSSVTLAESAKLAQDDLIGGVIDDVLTTNPIFELLPLYPMDGNALAYNRENALGDVQLIDVGDTITAKAPATFTQATTPLRRIIGDAEVDQLIAATRSGDNNQEAIQIASKAKNVSRKLQDQMINGDNSAPNLAGLLTLLPAGQTVSGGSANGDQLTLDLLDELLDEVKDKDGNVDYMMANSRDHRKIKSLLRALGGSSMSEAVELPSGSRVMAYSGVPIFRNDWLPVNQTKGTATNASTILAGTFDDGSGKHGFALAVPDAETAGFGVDEVGFSETKDEKIFRVKQYVNVALFSQLGIAGLNGIIP